ncbi:MAG: tetratricopeptide repeat protein [candidate division KSB1 bacterium]|nr:tetratricopeptide repeat protein [candidate division KSB1 bacterium]MDQ7065639.1 tetratricopeptide repeat protein [candidate division KSB1 bacterium]
MYWLSLALEARGEPDRAKKAIVQFAPHARSALLLSRLGELEFAQANYRRAGELFRQAFRTDSTQLEARLNWGRYLHWRGKRQQARTVLQYFVELYRAAARPDARLNFLTASACIYLNRFQDANDLFQEASKQAPQDWRIFIRWGNLFLDKYNYADASSVFEDALKINGRLVPARIGLARAKEAASPQQALKMVEDLLNDHDDRTDVLNYAAHVYLLLGRYEKAQKLIAKVLKQRPEHLEALTLKGRLALYRKRFDEFESIARRVLKVHPRYATFYTRAGDALAQRYLFEEAARMYRRAIALDAEDAAAHAGLGTTLSRLARLAEARAELEEAFELDAYNVWTGNLLNLFDSYADYDTIRTEHFLIRLHKDERPVLGPYAAEVAERAYRELVPRYRMQLNWPVTIEIFPDHDDFAVRSFGLPGAQVFLGICFGPLITMNSPRARPIGTFNWQETLWHEFAHVLHLTMTHNRVPRWLAEGISVYEAARANPAWDMDMHMMMIGALKKDELIPLAELDKGFVGDPRRVTFSYYQSSQMVRFIVQTFGFDRLLQLLAAFRDDLNTAQAIRRVFDLSLSQFDRQFAQWARQVFPVDQIEFDADLEKLMGSDQPSGKLLHTLLKDNPKLFLVKLRYAKYLIEKGEFREAIDMLVKVRDTFPEYVGPNNAYLLLEKAYAEIGDSASAAAQLSALLRRDGKNYRAALKLLRYAESLQRDDWAKQALELAIQIYPYNAELHRKLGRIYLKENRSRLAIREFEVLLALNPLDRADAHCNLAEAYLQAQQKRRAHRHALKALEFAPTYQRAQELLLKTASQ